MEITMMDPKELEVAKIIAKVFKEWGIHEGRNGGGDFYKWLAEKIAQEEKGKRWVPKEEETYYSIPMD